MEDEKILGRGAEAIIYLEENKNSQTKTDNKLKEDSLLTNKNQRRNLGASEISEQLMPSETRQFVIKDRIKKSYRIPELDNQIRKLRTRAEGKILEKASKIISVPKVFKADEKEKKLVIEFIEGKKLSDALDFFPLKEQKEICKKIGNSVAKLHDADIIHGDLTTSNMIYALDNDKKSIQTKNFQKPSNSIKNVSTLTKRSSKKSGRADLEEKENSANKNEQQNNFKIYFIDFGLAFHSNKNEDKAVDLHLLKQALEAKHFTHWETLFKEVTDEYKKTSKDSVKILAQFIKVEKRGRYKEH